MNEPKPGARFEVKTPAGTSHYKIASIERLPTGAAKILLITGDWLDAGSYQATYVEGDQRAAGEYAVIDYLSSGREKIEIVGIFTLANGAIFRAN